MFKDFLYNVLKVDNHPGPSRVFRSEVQCKGPVVSYQGGVASSKRRFHFFVPNEVFGDLDPKNFK